MSTLVVGPDLDKRGIEIIEDVPLGLGDPFGPDFPDKLYLIKYPGEMYGLYCHNGEHGLATFSSHGRAILYMDRLRGKVPSGSEIVEISFDDACDIAKAKGEPVVCVMLLDNLESPQIRYIA